ncbi:hypothetical protein [Planctomycetes bacterium K23_9]|uniref:Uncharacterized protein n=1 Tax=Stieleria marina TaxID=1930275 RepID=A0A517NVC4_9BACT|nr:hypothetical protein K239x_30720 [Planctomycetes bacterium K23_9]
MISISKWLLAPALATCFLLAGDSNSANAQGFSLSIGSSSCGGYGGGYRSARPVYHGGYGHSSHYRSSYRSSYRPSYTPTYRSRFHDTSHYDYHPTEIRRHGNHFDVVPGHYDLHRTGHWHH